MLFKFLTDLPPEIQPKGHKDVISKSKVSENMMGLRSTQVKKQRNVETLPERARRYRRSFAHQIYIYSIFKDFI